jgi:hypothetical protein
MMLYSSASNSCISSVSCVWGPVKNTGNGVSTGVHRCSGVEWGLDGKDLASAYVLHPREWQSLYFRVGWS